MFIFAKYYIFLFFVKLRLMSSEIEVAAKM